MAEIYNDQVLAEAAKIGQDVSAIVDSVHAIQQFSLTDRASYIARVRALGTKYGYDLRNWNGKDRPSPEPLE